MKIKILVVCVGMSLLFAACQAQTPSTSPTTQNQTTNTVILQNIQFTPQDVQVKVGQTVTWQNKDSVAHTVTSDTGVFDSGNLAAGSSFSFTFSNPGTYSYHCAIHPSMTGKITVTP